MTKYFISDTHFGHTNVIKFCDRPFQNLKEMEDKLIENINLIVKPEDVIYWLGDVVFGNTKEWRRILARVNCKNHILIKGNHDSYKSIPKDLFLGIFTEAKVYIHGKLFLLSHYPYRWPWWRFDKYRLRHRKLRPKPTGLWLLHGHTHETGQGFFPKKMIHVGVDGNGYKPVSETEIIQIVQKG